MNKKPEKNCAFQYYVDGKCIEDLCGLTINEAIECWNGYYKDFIAKAAAERRLEAVIWVNMSNDSDYTEKHVYLQDPVVISGKLYDITNYLKPAMPFL